MFKMHAIVLDQKLRESCDTPFTTNMHLPRNGRYNSVPLRVTESPYISVYERQMKGTVLKGCGEERKLRASRFFIGKQ